MRFFIVSALLILSSAIYAQTEKDNSAKQDYTLIPEEQEKITDKLQLFNRTNWRIQNINMLVNKRQDDNDFRLLKMELEKLSELIGIAQKQFEPKENKEKFTDITDKLKTNCAEMAGLANEKKRDEIKPKANELFSNYAKFKMSMKEKDIQDLQ